MHFHRLIAILLIAFTANGAIAQPATGHATVTGSYRYFDMKDGLPQMQVMSCIQDDQQFIWIGTKGGLARWDGNAFETYRGKNSGNSYPRYQVQTNINEHIILIGTTLKQIRGKQIRNISLPGRYQDAMVDYFCPLEGDRLLVNVFVKGNNLPKPYMEHIIYNYNTQLVTDVIITKGKIAGIENENNFYTMGDEKMLPTSYLYLYHNKQISDSITGVAPLNSMVRGNDSKHFYGSFIKNVTKNAKTLYTDNIRRIDIRKGKFRLLPIPLTKPLHLAIDYTASWIFINDSSYYYVDAAHVIHLVQGRSDVVYTKLESSNCALTDKSGNLWVGTEQGLYCFYKNSFSQYKFNFSEDGTDNTWSICKGMSNQYYIAEYNKGIYQYNDADKSWRKQDIHFPGNEYTHELNCGTFATTRLWDGSVLFPLANAFAVKKEEKIKVFTPLGTAEVYSVTTDVAKSCTYICGYTKVLRLNADLSLDTIGTPADAEMRNFMCSTLDREGNVMFGGSKDKYSLAVYKDGKLHPIPFHKRCLSMSTDHKGNIWISTMDSLFMYDGKDFHAVSIPINSQLTSVKYYNSKWLILGGGEEIILLDLETYYNKHQTLCFRYDHTNGYNGMECAQNSMCIDDDSSVWIPGVKSTWRFRPDALDKSLVLTQPVIDEILFSGHDLNWLSDTTFYQTSLSKDAAYRNLQFIFKAVKGNGLPLFYRYRLLNYQNEWSSPVIANSATYNRLPYGTYIFQVQCSMDQITWSEAAQSRPITLRPYLTETKLFKVLISILGLIVLTVTIIIILKWHYKKKAFAQQQKAQLVSLKLQSIRSKAIPHFSSNVYNNIDFLIENGQYTEASNYLAILSRLHSKMLVDADKASHSLTEELDFVSNYLQLEKLRFGDKLTYSIDVGPHINKSIQVPNMAVHTYVENAIKHGLMSKKGFGNILIKVAQDTNGILISVTDNGVGRKVAKALNKHSTGMGLSILSQQIDIYNSGNEEKITQSIIDLKSDGIDSGTECRLFIPYNFSFNKFINHET